MGNNVEMTYSEHRSINLLLEEFNARGGMSTEDLIIRLDAVPFDEFQKALLDKIRNFKV